jgi:hypothetical protein
VDLFTLESELVSRLELGLVGINNSAPIIVGISGGCLYWEAPIGQLPCSIAHFGQEPASGESSVVMIAF